MAVRGVDDHDIRAGIDQELGAGKALVAGAGRGGDPQTALLVLGGMRMMRRLLHVGDGDEADAFIVLIDHDQLLDPVFVQKPGRLGRGRRPRAR